MPFHSDSPFRNQVVVFAGRLASVQRRAARQLVERLGGAAADDVTTRTTMLVVGGGSPAPSGSGALRKAEAVNAAAPGRVRIVAEDEFCRLGDLPTADVLDRRYYSLRRIRRRYPRVRANHLRCLEERSLVRLAARTDVDRYYGFQDLRTVRGVSDDLEGGAPFRAVLRGLEAARNGQLTFDFDQRRPAAPPATVVALPARRRLSMDGGAPDDGRVQPPSSGDAALAIACFQEGAALDEGDERDRVGAGAAYRKALMLDPNLVPALVNLANVHYARDDLVVAQALYERAMRLDGECFEARFNLGNIHHDLGRHDDSVRHYRRALEIDPAYPDAHFYLAVTFEKAGRPAEARPHWRAYRELAPHGEWIELAREFTEQPPAVKDSAPPFLAAIADAPPDGS